MSKKKKHGKKSKRQQKEKPNWQPLSMLPTITSIIDGEVENFEELYGNLCQAKEQPYVLDNMTLDRAIENHRMCLEEAWVYDEQLVRWKKEELTDEQNREIERLTEKMKKYRKLCEQIIALSEEIKKGSIDSILDMDDMELAMAVLSGKLKMPGFGE